MDDGRIRRRPCGLNGTSQYVNVPALNLNSNTVTISGWIKRNGTQGDYTGIVFYRNGSGTASGISMRSSGTLTYNWNDNYSAYSWSSGLHRPQRRVDVRGAWSSRPAMPRCTCSRPVRPCSRRSTRWRMPRRHSAASPVSARIPVATVSSTEVWMTCGFATPALPPRVASFTTPTFRPRWRQPRWRAPATVTGKTATLTASGSSILGAGNLTYTWSSSGPGTVTFSPNGTNAAQNATATFSTAGTYTLGVTIADTYGQFTTSSVNVTVSQTLTSIAVALATNNLATTGVEQFAATAYDQFNYSMVNQPTFTWGFTSLVSGGLIDSSGDFQPPYAVGSAVISATGGGKTGQASVTYPGVAQWNSAEGLSWSGGSWIGTTSPAAVSPPGLRGVAGDFAQFTTSSGGGTISLGGATASLAGLTFASAQQLHAVRRRDESRLWSESGHDWSVQRQPHHPDARDAAKQPQCHGVGGRLFDDFRRS